MMTAWAIERFGDIEKEQGLVSLENLPMPKVERDDVLIRMHGAGIGDWETVIASGEWPMERSFPIVLGLAGSGTVEAVGRDVVGLERGDRVYTYSYPLSPRHNGAWAEFMLVPSDRVARAPNSIELTHAGAIPIVGLTAYESLIDVLKVGKGDVLLITAAAGGVGHLAVQIASRRGARVVVTARERNHEFLRQLGAEVTIDYTREDIVTAIREQFPGGVDKVLNGVEAESANDLVKVVRKGGHIVDLPGAMTAAFDDGRLDTDFIVRPSREGLTTLAGMFDRGELRFEVAHTVPFARAMDGLKEVLEKHVRGVVVIQIR